MQVVLDALRGSFVSCSVPCSAEEFGILTYPSILKSQLVPVSNRTSKIHFECFGVFFFLTRKLLNFPSEQCLLVKLKPTAGSEVVASV